MAGGEVHIIGLDKQFGEFAAVRGIDVEVAGGEFFSLLGPSGCGKTTTLRMVAGFEEPTAGKILIDGVDVAHVPPHRRPVNTVFQSYALFPFMTVWDNVAFGLQYTRATKDETKQRVGDALALVQMQGKAKSKPGPALRRSAATRRAGARARARPQGAAARRAARRPRRQAAQAAADRAQGAAGASWASRSST